MGYNDKVKSNIKYYIKKLQVLLRVKRLHDFGEELASRCDTPLWRNSESHLYTFSMEGVVAGKSTNKETSLVRLIFNFNLGLIV